MDQNKTMRAFKCISNSAGYWLTPGKIYQVELDVEPYRADKFKHLIINDKGTEHYIFNDELQDNFIDIELFREEQLNKLGI